MKVLGLSGGADSVYIFHHLRFMGESFRCIYINHKMNAHDDGAEQFCRTLCASYNVPLKVIDINKPLKNETEAREARYAAFVEDVKDDVLVLGHHMGDVVETMLMNLCKGTSLNGMSGIASEGTLFGMKFERPLIQRSISRTGIQRELTANKFSWYEDDTNKDQSILRNRVRHELIPLLEDMFPGCSQRITDFSDDCKFANEVVQEHVCKAINTKLHVLKHNLGKRELRFWFFDWMRSNNIVVSKRHFREFESFVDNDQYVTMYLPQDFLFVKAYDLTSGFKVVKLVRNVK